MSCSQRPDTLMQDRICQIDENLLHPTAGPSIGVKSVVWPLPHNREKTPSMTKRAKRAISTRNILTIDVGGSRVKFMTSGIRKKREFSSGSQLSAEAMVRKV